MSQDVQFDMTPYVGAIARILVEPYRELVARLEADGRLTVDEVAQLRATLLDRGERLGELVQEELRGQVAPTDAT